ncbi:MAG: DUF2961 domain-containing protein, partial [Abditibacteriales bacterium]|nr:DUF2961 domain-containing protein [Abditibacteriales bacterium]MDW8365814.1 DUF2961 domain-containing protein [Abditibacteriales bacterium]
MNLQKAIVIISAFCVSAFTASLEAQEKPLYGLQYLARFDQLPVLKNAVCKQVSSYDRSGGNGDAGHFLNGDVGHLPNNRALLADLKGPGCIYRIWSANATGFIRFYFDGESEPRIACPMQDLFQDKYPPFVRPLAGQSSGGWYCFFPIPFAKSVRIEVDDPRTMYYQIQYHQFPEGTAVRTFTRELTAEDKAALETVLNQWKNAGQPPVPLPSPSVRREGQTTLAGGAAVTMLNESRGGTIRGLRVRVTPATRFTLRRLVLRAYWDGAIFPSVEAPLGDFFGVGFGERRFTSLPLAMGEDGYVCYFPMPFGTSARVEVVNEGREDVQLTWQIDLDPTPPDMKQVGYFHAKWRRVTTERGKHVTLLETTGRGHYVGVNLNMQGDHGLWFLEGDEKIYVDGETFPSIHGTGLEDYFTAGWYFNTGPFWLPFHGCIVKDDPHSRIAAYRYQISDCVPFQKSIRVDIEHGGTNDYPGADYCFTTYWYQDSTADGWENLPPVEARRPASIKAQNVVEAETLNIVGGKVIDDEHLDVELSSGKGVAALGDALTFTVNLPTDSYYTIFLGLLKSKDGGRVQVSVNGQPLGEVDAQAEAPRLERVEAGMTGLLKQGAHQLTLSPLSRENQRGLNLIVDYLVLRKQLYPGALEGERLRVLATSHPNVLGPQDMRGFGPHWSNDAHLWFRPPQAGAFFTLQLPVRTTGKYRLSVYLTKAIDYGKVQISLNGKDIGGVFDGFNDGVIPSGKVDLGEVELTAG